MQRPWGSPRPDVLEDQRQGGPRGWSRGVRGRQGGGEGGKGRLVQGLVNSGKEFGFYSEVLSKTVGGVLSNSEKTLGAACRAPFSGRGCGGLKRPRRSLGSYGVGVTVGSGPHSLVHERMCACVVRGFPRDAHESVSVLPGEAGKLRGGLRDRVSLSPFLD